MGKREVFHTHIVHTRDRVGCVGPCHLAIVGDVRCAVFESSITIPLEGEIFILGGLGGLLHSLHVLIIQLSIRLDGHQLGESTIAIAVEAFQVIRCFGVA